MKPRLRPRFFIACDLPAPDSAFVGRLATELVHALSGRFGFRGGLVLFGLGTAEAHAIVGRLPLGFDARLLLTVLVEIDDVGHGSCAGEVDGQHSQAGRPVSRSEEHTSELQSLMRISYAVFCLKKKKKQLITRQ